MSIRPWVGVALLLAVVGLMATAGCSSNPDFSKTGDGPVAAGKKAAVYSTNQPPGHWSKPRMAPAPAGAGQGK